MVADKRDGHKHEGTARAKPAAAASRTPESPVVDALRSAYRETVDEEVPPDFLDLLGKLS